MGSSLFLRRAFGVGYRLTLEKTTDYHSNTQTCRDSVHDEHGDHRLKSLVVASAGDAELVSTAGKELSFHLPTHAASSFSIMLDRLEKEVKHGSISSFGLSMTTLEEVFQKTTNRFDGSELSSMVRPRPDYATPSSADRGSEYDPPRSTESHFYQKQAAAIFRKRRLMFSSDKKAWCCTTIVPVVFVLLGVLSLRYAESEIILEPLRLDLDNYKAVPIYKDKIPVTFNAEGLSFTCQPGWCSYQLPVVEEKETRERYFFCGAQSYLLSRPNCSQALSGDILNHLVADGVVPVPEDVHNLNEVRYTRATIGKREGP